MTVLGITGGSGCGKTTALEVLARRGAYIIDCDAVYHELLENDSELLSELLYRFPSAFEDGRLDRKRLGALVFSDADALAELNETTHKYIGREVDRRLSEQWKKGVRLFAIDAIALLDSDLADKCGAVIGVTAPDELRISRLMRREGVPEEYARLRILAQRPNSYFEEHCDYILENHWTELPPFISECEELFDKILGENSD